MPAQKSAKPPKTAPDTAAKAVSKTAAKAPAKAAATTKEVQTVYKSPAELKKAADENPVELPRTIASIDQEVEAVLD